MQRESGTSAASPSCVLTTLQEDQRAGVENREGRGDSRRIPSSGLGYSARNNYREMGLPS